MDIKYVLWPYWDYDSRLVYADWLIDRGDPRGEFIHIQCQLASGAHTSKKEELEAREKELIHAHGESWAAQMGLSLREVTFCRGFVEEIRTSWDKLVKAHRTVERDLWAPVKKLKIIKFSPSDMPKICRLYGMYAIKCLDLSSNYIGCEAAERLFSDEIVGRLSHLSLDDNNLGDAGAAFIAESCHLRRMEYIGIGWNNISSEGAKSIAKSVAKSNKIPNMKVVVLWGNDIRNDVACDFAEASKVNTNIKFMVLRLVLNVKNKETREMPIRILVECKGETPMLMNRMTEETLNDLYYGHKKPKNAEKPIPREAAEAKLHRLKDGRLHLPVEMLYSSLVAAGRWVRLDGKKTMSTAKYTLLPLFLVIEDKVIPLYKPGTAESPPWEVDMRHGKNPNSGDAVCVVRPRLDDWAFSFSLLVDENEASESKIRQLVENAGKFIGIGDHRPARKGVNGCFKIVSWICERDMAAAELSDDIQAFVLRCFTAACRVVSSGAWL